MMAERQKILIVDDSPGTVEILSLALGDEWPKNRDEVL